MPVIELLALLVIPPLVGAVIGYAAWKGKPTDFGRDMYWMCSVIACLATVSIGVYLQRMDADMRTSRYPLQLVLFGLDVLCAGIAFGCLIGAFAYRRGI